MWRCTRCREIVHLEAVTARTVVAALRLFLRLRPDGPAGQYLDHEAVRDLIEELGREATPDDVTELAAPLQGQADVLAQHVQFLAEQAARAVNEEGPEAQTRFLLEYLGKRGAAVAIQDALTTPQDYLPQSRRRPAGKSRPKKSS